MSESTVIVSTDVIGGILDRRPTSQPTERALFGVRSAGSVAYLANIFLSPSEAAQWAKVLAEYADGES